MKKDQSNLLILNLEKEINSLVNIITMKWDNESLRLPDLGKFSNFNKYFNSSQLTK
jgi:hypothetical protein